MRVLGLVSFAKVALLHDGGQGGNVGDGRFGRCRVVVLFEDVQVLRTMTRVSVKRMREAIQVRRTWWKTPLWWYFCKKACWPRFFSLRVFSARSVSSLSRSSSGIARRASTSSRTFSRLRRQTQCVSSSGGRWGKRERYVRIASFAVAL